MNKVVKKLWEVFLDVLYPRQCCHCKKVGEYLCNSCLANASFQLFPVEVAEMKYLDDLLVCFQFEGAVRSVISSVKYQSIRGACELLAEFLYYYLQFPKVDYLVPVPMNEQRRSDRGFNQTEEMVKFLVKFSTIKGVNALGKKKHTKNQASVKDRIERRKNVFDTFELLEGAEELLKGKTVALVDDVVTTGATLNECARMLKQAGANEVYGVVVAHGG